MEKLDAFISLANVFNENGYSFSGVASTSSSGTKQSGEISFSGDEYYASVDTLNGQSSVQPYEFYNMLLYSNPNKGNWDAKVDTQAGSIEYSPTAFNWGYYPLKATVTYVPSASYGQESFTPTKLKGFGALHLYPSDGSTDSYIMQYEGGAESTKLISVKATPDGIITNTGFVETNSYEYEPLLLLIFNR